jgi:hypothetical protein
MMLPKHCLDLILHNNPIHKNYYYYNYILILPVVRESLMQ